MPLFKELEGHREGCRVTDEARKLGIDHSIPRATGGGSDAENYPLICSSCHRSKGDKPAYLQSPTCWASFQRRTCRASLPRQKRHTRQSAIEEQYDCIEGISAYEHGEQWPPNNGRN
ncbi:MAG: HNH endonuclease [Alphaproteobacteria bacterium]|nr:HNH endonuclease [Alphaproteobacteria bacterium]